MQVDIYGVADSFQFGLDILRSRNETTLAEHVTKESREEAL